MSLGRFIEEKSEIRKHLKRTAVKICDATQKKILIGVCVFVCVCEVSRIILNRFI
jgi:hypothetical protein